MLKVLITLVVLAQFRYGTLVLALHNKPRRWPSVAPETWERAPVLSL
jgi:hypothetical protein